MFRRDSMSVPEALKVLEMPIGSKIEDIKKNYYKLAMKYHPDKNIGDKKAEKKMKLINVAYEVCRNYVNNKNKQPQKFQSTKTGWVVYTCPSASVSFDVIFRVGEVKITFM